MVSSGKPRSPATLANVWRRVWGVTPSIPTDSRTRRDRAPPPALSATAPYRVVPGADMRGRAGRTVFSSYPRSDR